MSGHPISEGGGASPPELRLQCPPRGPGPALMGRPSSTGIPGLAAGTGWAAERYRAGGSAAAAAGMKRGVGMRPGLAGAELLQEAGPTTLRFCWRLPCLRHCRARRLQVVALRSVNPAPPFTRPANSHSPQAPTSAFSSSSSSSSTSFHRPHCSRASCCPRRAPPPGAPGREGAVGAARPQRLRARSLRTPTGRQWSGARGRTPPKTPLGLVASPSLASLYCFTGWA